LKATDADVARAGKKRTRAAEDIQSRGKEGEEALKWDGIARNSQKKKE